MDLKNGQSFPCLRGCVFCIKIYRRRIHTHTTHPAEDQTETLWGSGFKPTGDVVGPLGVGERMARWWRRSLGLFWATSPSIPQPYLGTSQVRQWSFAEVPRDQPPSLPQRGHGEVSHCTPARQSQSLRTCGALRLQRSRVKDPTLLLPSIRLRCRGNQEKNEVTMPWPSNKTGRPWTADREIQHPTL